ncbi:MAG: lysylphosphatidylglycerol synthase transmembrane domain-containing protein [Gaiella sp.]
MRRLRRFFSNPWTRGLLVLASLALALAAIWWRGPEWDLVYHAFDFVDWWWILVALGLNLLSVLSRALSWNLTIRQALPDPHPSFGHVFTAFGVGLLGNAVLPARAGELARVAVLRRHVEHGRGTSATLLGTVFAHRLFDLFPVALLVGFVLMTAKIPHWAVTALVIVGLVGVGLLAVAVLSARREKHSLDSAGTVLALVSMARQGFAVLRTPASAVAAILLQTIGWALQLLAVWAVTAAFSMGVPLHAAALVLLLMNVATVFPLWPGNVGLLQAAVAFPLVRYGVAYPTGFAFGLVLQALEMSVGVGVGLVSLGREGLSFASLKRMEEQEEESVEDALEELDRGSDPVAADEEPVTART